MNEPVPEPMDETLEDEAVDLPADPEQREALLDQRFVHGLLRTMHTADPVAREARVQAVLARVAPVPVVHRLRPLAVAAAALLLAALGTWLLLPDDSELEVDAAVGRALHHFDQPTDNRYAVTLTVQRGDDEPRVRRFEAVVRRGERFRLRGDGPMGPFVAGSNGHTVWCQPGGPRWLRWSRAHDRSMRLGTVLATSDVESSDLELRHLIEGLERRAARVQVTPVPASDDAGGARTRVEAFDVMRGHGHRGGRTIDRLAFEIEDATGVVQHVELEERMRETRRQVQLDWLGVAEDVGDTAYERPW